MPSPDVSELLMFDRIDAKADPFLHFTCPEFYTPDAAAVLLDWLKTTPQWKVRRTEYWEANAFFVTASGLSLQVQGLFSAQLIGAVKRRLESVYEVKLSPNIFIEAYRHEDGHQTVVHTDHRPEAVGEADYLTHRVITYLNDGWDESMGGRLRMFRQPAGDAEPVLARQYAPLHNTAASLAVSERSLHQVERMDHGRRYSLVWSFRTEDGRTQSPDARPNAFTS
ncbi:2OG-Fe(II) oxygenase [Streptomyces monashensis]|nr:2OG-Fe(II) oxygenase [Streptomyces monashensis]